MSKKNIDDLFQEKLKDFGEIPDEKVWKAISSSLDKQKKSKKAFPFWWKVSGLAAGLALLFYLVNPLENTLTKEDTITNKEEKKSPSTNDTERSKDGLFDLPLKEAETLVDLDKNKGEDSKKDKQKPIIKVPNTVVVESQKTVQDRNSKRSASFDSKDESIANSEASKPTENLTQQNNNAKTEVVSNNNERPETNTPIEEGKSKELSNLEGIAKVEAKEQEESKKKFIFEAIEEQEKEDAIAEVRKDKWSVGPSVAPVYFNAIGEGSPIHSNFVSNSKSGQTNLSYGMVVSYDLSKKIQIRTGIHKANYGYNTNEIAFSSSAELSPNALISNIDYAMASRNVVVNSRKTEAFNDPAIATDALAASSPNREGLMAQNFGYLEVPLELNYALLDKKFGINLIGGISSLFLTDNSISLESGGFETEVGEANNLNSVNFSTNIGFGVNYKFTPQLQLNVEPLFKYQLNTFSQTSGIFNPFSIGIYSGINFKF